MVGMIRFRIKIEPNRIERFAKFKITEWNRTVSNRTKLLSLVPLKKI